MVSWTFEQGLERSERVSNAVVSGKSVLGRVQVCQGGVERASSVCGAAGRQWAGAHTWSVFVSWREQRLGQQWLARTGGFTLCEMGSPPSAQGERTALAECERCSGVWGCCRNSGRSRVGPGWSQRDSVADLGSEMRSRGTPTCWFLWVFTTG